LIKDLSSLLYKRAKKVIEEKVNVIRQDIIAENQTKKASATAAVIPLSSEIFLKKMIIGY
jgi:hypothetical protein